MNDMYSSGVIDISEPMGTPFKTEYGAGSATERTSGEIWFVEMPWLRVTHLRTLGLVEATGVTEAEDIVRGVILNCKM